MYSRYILESKSNWRTSEMPQLRRLKVALIVYRDDPSTGGSLRVGQVIAQNLPTYEVEVHLVFAYGGPGPISQSVSCPTHFLQATSSRDWNCWKKTRKWFKEMHFDVVHFVDCVNWIFFATVGVGGKRIDHYHGRPLLEFASVVDKLIALVKRWFNAAAIAITHGAKRTVVRNGWMSSKRVHVVYNGVNLQLFDRLPGKIEARKQLGLPEKTYLFGMIARVTTGNGVMELLDVLKRLPDQWHGVMVGDGPLRKPLLDNAQELGLADRMHATGAIGDVRPAYAALDAVVFLGRYQPFCLMLAEAMLAQVPLVGLQGAGEYTEPENPLITATNSLLFPRIDPWEFSSKETDATYDQLANAVQNVILQPDVTRKRVVEGLAWVKSRFSAKKQANECLQVYRHVLGHYQVAPCEL